jgi:hypothetical protein
MRKLNSAIAVAVGTLFAGAAFAQSNYSIEQRDRTQDMRIEQGVRSGEITRQEAAGLERERAQVERMERRARADGVVTQQERARIDQAQNRVGRDIYRESHDAQVANRGGRGWERANSWERHNVGERGNFERRERSAEFRGREFGHAAAGESHVRPVEARTGGDGHWGNSAQAPGRQAHLQQTPVQQNHVEHAQLQRTQAPQAQSQASRPVTVARQGGYGGRQSR